MADPVSWFLVRPGWEVVASDGSNVGTVAEVVGDEERDIFDGLAVGTGLLGKPRYVPAEQVGLIEEGTVHLTLDAAAASQLGEYSR
jgi:hypothetical protein